MLGFRGNYCPGLVYFLSHPDVLVSVIEACDIAIYHASRSPKNRVLIDLEIEKAVRKVHDYAGDFHAK